MACWTCDDMGRCPECGSADLLADIARLTRERDALAAQVDVLTRGSYSKAIERVRELAAQVETLTRERDEAVLKAAESMGSENPRALAIDAEVEKLRALLAAQRERSRAMNDETEGKLIDLVKDHGFSPMREPGTLAIARAAFRVGVETAAGFVRTVAEAQNDDQVGSLAGEISRALLGEGQPGEGKGPNLPRPLQRLSPEELEKAPRLTQEEIDRAIQKGRQDWEAAQTGRCPPSAPGDGGSRDG